jgi:hypothetical protein
MFHLPVRVEERRALAGSWVGLAALESSSRSEERKARVRESA